MSAAGASAPLLVYGGTFDPVHDGHVAVATRAADALGIDEVRLIPAGDPPHRPAPRAAGPLRAEMLRRAFADDCRFSVDERELGRARPSYTLDTLRELRAEVGAARPLLLLLGADAFAGLPGWHRWREIPRLAHLVVFARPDVTIDAAMWPPGLPPASAIEDPGWRQQPAGAVLVLPRTVSAHAATAIRARLAAGEPAPEGLPAAVASLLAERNPYR